MSQVCPRLILCKASDVAAGQAIKIEKNGLTLAVFNLDGEFHVTNDACTHGPGSLSEGCISDGVVECDFHNGAFDIRTGEAVTAPCVIPIKIYKTHREGNDISIEIEDL